MDTFVPTVPLSLSERLIWRDESFHASAELKGNVELDLLFRQTAKRLGRIVPCRWYTPKDFESRFGIRFATQDSQRENAVIESIIDLLHTAQQQKVSDIHITYYGPYTTIAFRKLGLLGDYKTLNGQEGLELITGLFQSYISQTESNFSRYSRYDGRIADRKFLPDGLFAVRLHSEPIQSPLIPEPGVSVAMRLLCDATSAHGPLKERAASLGFTSKQQDMLQWLTERSGLTIIAGATGHGKSTLLKNVMEAMAEYCPTKNYWSMEDPPEYAMRGVKQALFISKCSTEGERLKVILDALAGLLRSDLDVGMVGEIRYPEVAQAAISAAITGHTIWSTLHASSAIGIIARLREMGISMSSICNDGVLNGLVYQRLMPILCPECKQPLVKNPKAISEQLWNRLQKAYQHGEIDNIFVRNRAGCSSCSGMGIVGLKVAAEVIPVNNDLITRIKRNDLRAATRFWIAEMDGMTHVAHARQRIAAGEVDPALAEERMGLTLDHDLQLMKEAS